LATLFAYVNLAVLPPPTPGPQGANSRHVVAFLLSGSFFLGLTRLLRATLVGFDFEAKSDPAGAQPSTARQDTGERPSLTQYIAVYLLAPVTLKSAHPEKPSSVRYRGRPLAAPLPRGSLKVLALVVVLRMAVLPYRAAFAGSLFLTAMVGNPVLYLFLSGVEDLFCAVLEHLFDVEMSPSFNNPWLAQSSREFWAKRWHLPFHESIKAVTSRVPRRWLPPSAAAWLGFLYSGLSHVGQVQVTMNVMEPLSTTLLFFFVAAFLATVEGSLLGALDRAVPSPSWRPWARRIVILSSLQLASVLFWYPFWQIGFLEATAETVAAWW
jgi:hypothetical protein